MVCSYDLILDTVKLWDLRKLSGPVAVVEGVCNYFSDTNIVYSPNDRFVITGTSVKKADKEAGKINIYDSQTLELVEDISVAPGGIHFSLIC
jgi:sugar lactone lactonase YvrE